MNAYTGANAPSTAAVRQFSFPPGLRASISVLPLTDLLRCAGHPPDTGAAIQPALAAEAAPGSGRIADAAPAPAESAAPVHATAEAVLGQVVVQSATTEQAQTAQSTVMVEERTACVAVRPAADAAPLRGSVQATTGSPSADVGAASVACEEAAEPLQPEQVSLPTPAAVAATLTANGGGLPDGAAAASPGPSEPAAGPSQHHDMQQNGTVQAPDRCRLRDAEPSGRSLPEPVQQVCLGCSTLDDTGETFKICLPLCCVVCPCYQRLDGPDGKS